MLEKLLLRRKVLATYTGAPPVVIETNGGFGELYRACYSKFEGCVFERKREKTQHLAKQRPTWAVYRGDNVKSIAAGLGSHLDCTLLDVDPYGDPWPIIDAWFSSQRSRPDLWMLVTDGMRQALGMNIGWQTGSLSKMAEKYGNDALHENYLAICREMLAEKAAKVGYELTKWTGYYCGKSLAMTHYAAYLTSTNNRETRDATAERLDAHRGRELSGELSILPTRSIMLDKKTPGLGQVGGVLLKEKRRPAPLTKITQLARPLHVHVAPSRFKGSSELSNGSAETKRTSALLPRSASMRCLVLASPHVVPNQI